MCQYELNLKSKNVFNFVFELNNCNLSEQNEKFKGLET